MTQRVLSQQLYIDSLGRDPIPAKSYYSPDCFELEKQAIFRRTWLQIAHMCELPEPGSFIVRPIEAVNVSILITRGPDDVIRTFYNVCTHRGSELVHAQSGKRSSFGCIYHQWNFSYDGRLRAAPDFENFYVDKALCSLKPVAVEVVAGLIFVNLDPEPKQGLRDYLGPIAARLELLPVSKAKAFSEYTYEINANWKLVIDNFQENYHLRFIHSRSGSAGLSAENPFGYPADFGFSGPHATQVMASNPAPEIKPVQGFALAKQVELAMRDGLTMGPHNREYSVIFPNYFVFGSLIQPFTHRVMPIAPDRSRGVFRFYWLDEDDCATRRFAREYAMLAARDLHSEDRTAVESSQRGLNSGALQHIHFQAEEVLCRHFFATVKRFIEEYQESCRATGGAT